ncbi:MAG: hypothetical protein ACN6QC_14025, partial [Paraburkholderia hospita]
LLFFAAAAAKKSRCRPAQGRRLKHEGKTRMPAQKQKNHKTQRQANQKPTRPQAKKTITALQQSSAQSKQSQSA